MTLISYPAVKLVCSIAVWLSCFSDASVTSTIQDALDQFFQSETIEYTCESCEHKQVLVSHKFYRLPRCVSVTSIVKRSLRSYIDPCFYLL